MCRVPVDTATKEMSNRVERTAMTDTLRASALVNLPEFTIRKLRKKLFNVSVDVSFEVLCLLLFF